MILLEAQGSRELKRTMTALGWTWDRITPGKYGTPGMSDVYATHPKHGVRWIEMKAPGGKLRKTQLRWISKMVKNGVGVWVLRDADDYYKLFEAPNWYKYA